MIDANEYGRALFLLAEEEGVTDAVLEDARILEASIRSNPDYIKLLDTPAVSKEEKLGLLGEALSSLHPHLVSLVMILTERKEAHSINGVISAFCDMYDKSRGIERVEAVSAIPLTDSQSLALKTKLEGMTGKQIIINNIVDPTILGGIKLRYLGIQLDGSVKTRLDGFAKSLRDTVI